MLPVSLKSIGGGITLLHYTPSFNSSSDNKSLLPRFVEPVKVLHFVQRYVLSDLQKDNYAGLLFCHLLNLTVPLDCTSFSVAVIIVT